MIMLQMSSLKKQKAFRLRHDHVTNTGGCSCENEVVVGEAPQKLQAAVVEMELSCKTAAKNVQVGS